MEEVLFSPEVIHSPEHLFPPHRAPRGPVLSPASAPKREVSSWWLCVPTSQPMLRLLGLWLCFRPWPWLSAFPISEVGGGHRTSKGNDQGQGTTAAFITLTEEPAAKTLEKVRHWEEPCGDCSIASQHHRSGGISLLIRLLQRMEPGILWPKEKGKGI